MNNQYGGYITSSFVSQIIVDISRRTNQTPEIKRAINMSVTNSGHGSILLGSSARLERGDRNIRMLVGAHFARHGALKIGTFGGKCNRGEMTIDTMIRETIEEIFNFEASHLMIDGIREFLNINTDFYYIYQFSETNRAYSYIFDVSILGDFIRIIDQIYKQQNIALYIPANDSFSNIDLYLENNIKFGDMSSFNGTNTETGYGTTIRLVEFMRNRYLSKGIFETCRRMGIRRPSGLDEIKYVSFVSLSKLLAGVPSGRYDLFNFTKNRRENLQMQEFLIKLLGKDIIRIILSYN
jgi:hypothetical protein